jgi:hypothetical protein
VTDISEKLTTWVTTFEDVLHIISGPFLAAGALIATSFVFTDGAIGKGGIGTALLIFWSITQAVGLDFQVLSLGYKSINAARSGHWGVMVFLVLLAGVLGFVGVQTHAVFGFVSSNSSTIPAAMQAMGIDQRVLLWERAGLSFLLTFIAGAMRPAPKVNDQAQVIEASAIEVIQEQLADLDKKIEALPVAAPAQQQLPSVAESKLAEVLTRIESLTMTVTQITQAPMIVTSDSVVSPMTVTPIAESRESEIRALLKRDPGMTYYEIAKQIGCANATAKKWKERIELNG